MKKVDVHCHLDENFFPDVEEVIERMRKHNTIAIPAGIHRDTNRHVLALQEKYSDVIFPALGIYPPDALEKEVEEGVADLDMDFDVDEEIAFIKKNADRIIAIGEIGMDFKTGHDKKRQEEIFRKQVELAMELDKPIIVHSRKAEREVIDILEEYDYWKVVMHCFSGKQSLVRRVRENQWFFSIPANVVKDEHFQRIVKETPLPQLLTETDAPFLSPNDKRNEPIFIMETISKIAQMRNMAEVDVTNILWRNCQRLFGQENFQVPGNT